MINDSEVLHKTLNQCSTIHSLLKYIKSSATSYKKKVNHSPHYLRLEFLIYVKRNLFKMYEKGLREV